MPNALGKAVLFSSLALLQPPIKQFNLPDSLSSRISQQITLTPKIQKLQIRILYNSSSHKTKAEIRLCISPGHTERQRSGWTTQKGLKYSTYFYLQARIKIQRPYIFFLKCKESSFSLLLRNTSQSLTAPIFKLNYFILNLLFEVTV